MKIFYHLYFLIEWYFRRHAKTYQTQMFTYGDFKFLVLIIWRLLGHSSAPPKKWAFVRVVLAFFFLASSAGSQISSPEKTLVGTWKELISINAPAFRVQWSSVSSHPISINAPALRVRWSSVSNHPIVRGAMQLLNYS